MMSNEKKRQLGMSQGTARNKLVKRLLFKLAQKCNEDICFQCGKKIECVDQLSIEHKIPWLHSDDPLGLFMDVDNVTFSHHSCNCKAGARKPPNKLIPCPSYPAYVRGCRCKGCCEAAKQYWRNRRNKPCSFN